MFGKKKSTSKTPAASESPGKPSVHKYEKPNIFLIDVDDGIRKQLAREGFNVTAGTFGSRYKVPKSDNYFPVYVSYDLPNCSEQEIVVIDLASPAPLEHPTGEKQTSMGENDWWAKSSLGHIDPRPRAMLGFQNDFNRILDHGGIFVVFADWNAIPEVVFASRPDNYSFHIDREISCGTLSFLERLDQLSLANEVGGEIRYPNNGDPLCELVGNHLNGARFFCTVTPKYRGNEWKRIAVNKFDEPVGLVSAWDTKKGLIIVLPRLSNPGELLVSLLKNVLPEASPHLFPHSESKKWIHRQEYELPAVLNLQDKLEILTTSYENEVRGTEEKIEKEREKDGWMHDLLTAQDTDLVSAVRKALSVLGFQKIIDVDEEQDKAGKSRREDLQVTDQSPTLIVDIKGLGGMPTDDDALQSNKHATMRMREWKRVDVTPLTIINHQRNLPAFDRDKNPFRKELIGVALESSVVLASTWDLYRLLRSFLLNKWKPGHVIPIFYKAGRLEPIPVHYSLLGTIAHVWDHSFGVVLAGGQLRVGDFVAVETDGYFEEKKVVSLQENGAESEVVKKGGNAGIRLETEHEPLKVGLKVYRVS